MTQSVTPPVVPAAPVPAAPASTPPVATSTVGAVKRLPMMQVSRMATFGHAVFFVLGFTVVFTLLGSAIGLLGRSLNPYMPVVQKFGAILLFIFALITFGVFSRVSAWLRAKYDLNSNPAAAALVNVLDWFNALLYTERRVTDMSSVSRRWGYASSFLLGVSFSAGWVPCIGPILSSIFLVASDSTTVAQGASLLAVYSLGLGIPFLITGLFFTSMTPVLRRLNRHANIVSIISGAFLLYVAYLLWFDRLASLTTQFAWLNDFVFAVEDWLGLVSGTGGDIAAAGAVGAYGLALVAGMISFISPCVLPLVPAYIGFLTSTTVGSGAAKKV
ncbi:MAG: cytochrome c biogenesis protein CcdA [Caldilineaceae bacterium]